MKPVFGSRAARSGPEGTSGNEVMDEPGVGQGHVHIGISTSPYR